MIVLVVEPFVQLKLNHFQFVIVPVAHACICGAAKNAAIVDIFHVLVETTVGNELNHRILVNAHVLVAFIRTHAANVLIAVVVHVV